MTKQYNLIQPNGKVVKVTVKHHFTMLLRALIEDFQYEPK